MLRTALSNIRRSPFQAMAAVLVLAVSFFVTTIIAVLIYSSSQILNYFETRPQVIVFLKNDAQGAPISELRGRLEKDERVKDVKFVSKEDALQIYKNATSDNPLLGQLVSPSIFPASLEFSLKDLNTAAEIIDQVKKDSIVDSVGFTASLGNDSTLKDVIGRLTRVTLYIRIGGIVLASVLAFTSFFVLTVLISMRISTRKGDIDTLKLMGATYGFISGPILLESIIYVCMGILIGWLLGLILILYATPSVISYFGGIAVLPKQGVAFFGLNLAILGIEFAVGLVIAIAGGLIAVSRANR